MFSGKKLLLLGFILVLLIAIPITVYLVQQQQQTRIKAAPSTTLSINPTPHTMNVGDKVDLDVMMDPGQNSVSFVKFTLTYDSTKVEVKNGDFKPNTSAFPSVLQGPTYGAGSVSVTMNIGGSLDKIITSPTKVATLTVTALAPTNGTSTKVEFGTPQVLSVGSSDTFNENVFSSATPGEIIINEGTATTTTSSTTSTTTSSTTSTTVTTTTIPVTTTTAPATTNLTPSCSSLTLDNSGTGTAPYALNFTTTGTDTDGTISKVTFNFGDGQVQDVTSGGGIGSASATVTAAHTYTTAGTYTASAIFTDNLSGVSGIGPCSQTITIQGTTTAATTTPTTEPATATPTMAASGPGNTMITIGAIGAILSIVGVMLLFVL